MENPKKLLRQYRSIKNHMVHWGRRVIWFKNERNDYYYKNKEYQAAHAENEYHRTLEEYSFWRHREMALREKLHKLYPKAQFYEVRQYGEFI